MSENDQTCGCYASSPCMAGEIAPDYYDPLAVDPRAGATLYPRWACSIFTYYAASFAHSA